MRRPLAFALSGLLIVGIAATSAPATNAAPQPPRPPVREGGPASASAAADALTALAARSGVRQPAGQNKPGRHQGYPRQTQLRVYPEDPADRSIKLGLMPYHGIAPLLNSLQAASDRVSAEVVGQSALGRDLYLVTLTAPESAGEAAKQAAWRRLIEQDPSRAAQDNRLRRGYKAPVFINANIHGNEWEGTDAVLRVISDLATSDDPAVERLLRTSRIYVNVTANPDGRIAGTRANGNGFDLNRDLITGSQPEARAIRQIAIDAQAYVMLDEHGYTGDTLIEPSTAPHGQNYDYDLYIRHAYANALNMEQAVNALGYPETAVVTIPFRDFAPGDWDDWPPIFAPMYSIYHGSIGHTVEIPLSVNGANYQQLPVEELRRRSAINTAVSEATVRAGIRYADANRADLLAGQIELFRRGWAGEPQRDIPDGYVPGFGPEDRYQTQFPRAYVIPVGRSQRSPAAAARLVDHLVANDVLVTKAKRSFQLGGRWYPAGSYVVDLHQAKRGLANVMLEAGRDISDLVPQMYDISGWSHRLLWGASVDVLASGPQHLDVRGGPIVIAEPTGHVGGRPGRDLAIRVLDGKDVAAVNDLLARGWTLQRRNDGWVLVPAAARKDAGEVARRYGAVFTAAPPGATGEPLRQLTIAAAVGADELFALREMGFAVRPVSTSVLNAGFDWTDVDVLIAATGLSWNALSAAARAELQSFLTRGGVVTRGGGGAAFNTQAGLLTVTPQAGRGDANGVVDVTNAGGPVTAGALPQSFVYSPLWFTGLGPEVRAEQRYAAGDVLVAGHWLPNETGGGGQEAAAGQASVVSGVDETGARVAMFGTQPLFRAHPKGLYAQFAQGLLWAGSRVVAPV